MSETADQRAIREVDAMSDEELLREWKAARGSKPGGPDEFWMVRLGVKYHKIIEAMQREHRIPSQTLHRRYGMARELDADGLRKESDFLGTMYDSNGQGDNMKKGKEKKEKRVTASSVLIRLLGAAHVKDDETIIEEVRGETGSKKFDKTQLAWYKYKYRLGALNGMDGKRHVIEQGSHTKEKKVKKAKKVVIKDRRSKEAVAA